MNIQILNHTNQIPTWHWWKEATCLVPTGYKTTNALLLSKPGLRLSVKLSLTLKDHFCSWEFHFPLEPALCLLPPVLESSGEH